MFKSKIGFMALCTAIVALIVLAVWGGLNIYKNERTASEQNQEESFNPTNAVQTDEMYPEENNTETAYVQDVESSEAVNTYGYYDPDLMNIVHVGDTIDVGYDPESMLYTSDIQLTVNSAMLQKDFTGITTDCIGREGVMDYSKYLDDNGLLTVHRQEVKADENKEIIHDETIQQYILKLDVTLTRNDENYQKDTYFSGLSFDAGVFSFGNDNSIICEDAHLGERTLFVYEPNVLADSVSGSRKLAPGLYIDTFFAFYTVHEHDKKSIRDLQPHESADVTLYYTVDADRIGNLYVSLLSGGPVGVPNSLENGFPVLDLCELTAPE